MADDWGITGVEIDAILKAQERDDWWEYRQALHDASADKDSSPAKWLLAEICGMGFRPSSRDRPYVALGSGPGFRTLEPQDLLPEQLDFIARIADETKNADLSSRLFDILWILRHDRHACLRAAESFFVAAKEVEDPQNWRASIDRYSRALILAKSLGKSTDLPDRIGSHLLDRVRHYNGTDELYLTRHLVQLLYVLKKGKPAELVAFLEKGASTAKVPGNDFRHREYLELAAKLADRAGDVAKSKSIRLMIAESLVVDAGIRSQAGQAGAAHSFYEDAILIMRQIGEAKRVEELVILLNAAGKESLKSMQKFEFKIDVSDQVKAAQELMAGCNANDGIIRLASIFGAFDPNELEAAVKEDARQAPLSSIIPMTHMSSDGKKVAMSKGLSLDHDVDNSEALRVKVVQKAVQQYGLIGAAAIKPALAALRQETQVGESDIAPFVVTSRFVAPGCTEAFIRGLTAGFHWDFYGALSFLLPQFEQSLRWHLQLAGVITSSLDTQGIEEEWPLGKLLSHQVTRKTFGPGLILAMRAYLVDKVGPNIRNLSLHGVLKPQEHNTMSGMLVWWLTLKLVVLGSPIAKAYLEKQLVTDETPER